MPFAASPTKSDIFSKHRHLLGALHFEKTLQACARGDDPANISVALQLVLQAERVPYSVKKSAP
jgi:hypothetical protein